MALKTKQLAIGSIASITRRFHPRGTGRILHWLHNPDVRPWSVSTVARMPGNIRLLVNTAHWIEWCVFFFGAYEPETIAILQQCIRPGRNAIDVGANIGTHTLPMARSAGTGRVIAFEPNPAIFARLECNLALNAECNVDARPIALGDQAGDVPLFCPPSDTNPGRASLVDDPALTKSVTVPCATLDSLAITDVDLIKIDVQGFEVAVLRGARTLLAEQRPIIVFEYDASAWGLAEQTFSAARQLLTGLGYTRFLLIGQRGLKPIPQPIPRFMNVLAYAQRGPRSGNP